MLHLQCASSDAWLNAVMADFDAFLIDHAACERKASAAALAFVVRYPDRTHLIEPLIEVAREELEHFHQVYRLIAKRGLRLTPDTKDPYIKGLLAEVRSGGPPRLLDRLIISGLFEARGCERFGRVAEALPAGELKDFYAELTRSEARHHALYIRLARNEFEESDILSRVEHFLAVEARIVQSLPPRPALH